MTVESRKKGRKKPNVAGERYDSNAVSSSRATPQPKNSKSAAAIARSRAKMQNLDKQEFKQFVKNEGWKEYKKYAYVVLALVVAFMGYYIYQFSMSKHRIHHIQVSNPEQLQSVFRSGDPWMIYCAKPSADMPKMVAKAARGLTKYDIARTGVMDCTETLPSSGKSVLQRFKINPRIQPTIFVVANGQKPKQVELNALQKAKFILGAVKKLARKKLLYISNTEQLHEKCVLRPHGCVLFVHGRPKLRTLERQLIDKVMDNSRLLTYAFMDGSKLRLQLPNFKKRATTPSLFFKHDAKKDQTYFTSLNQNKAPFEFDTVNSFVQEAVASDFHTDVKNLLETLPEIVSKKVVSPEEEAKRDEKARQKSDRIREIRKQQRAAQEKKTQEKPEDEGPSSPEVKLSAEEYFPQAADESGDDDQAEDYIEDEEVIDFDDLDDE